MAETVRGLNIKLTLDGKDLENELKGIKSELREDQKDLKAINKNLRFDSTNVSLWKTKQAKLNDILVETKKKLENQNEQLKNAKQAVQIGDMSEKEYNKLKRNVQYTEAEVSNLNNKLEKTSKKIFDLGNVKWDKVASMGSTLTKSVTVPILGAVSALSAFAVKSAYSADEFGDTASKLGLSAEAFQEWSYTAGIMATSTESLEKGFIKVNTVLGEIASGEGDKVADSLALIGLSVDDLKGKDTDQAFEIIRSALSGVGDESIRVAVANDIFGENIGSELLPMLSAEADTISGLRNDARELGIVTNEEAEIAGTFTDTLDACKHSLSNLGISLSMTLLPAVTVLIDKVQNEVVPTFKNWIDKWAEMSSGTKKMIGVLLGVASAVGPVMTVVGKGIPILKAVMLGLKGVGTGGMFAGAGINFATLGIGALVAILAMALMQSDTFKESLMNMGQTLMDLINPIMDIVQILIDALQPIFQIIIDLVVKVIELLMPLLEILLKPLIIQFQMLGKYLQLVAPLIEMVANLCSAILVPALDILMAFLEPILDVIQKIIDGVSWLIDKASGPLEKLGGAFGDMSDWFKDKFNLGNSNSNVATTNNSNKNTTNNVTVNTTSSTFDIDSINQSLGGNYL